MTESTPNPGPTEQPANPSLPAAVPEAEGLTAEAAAAAPAPKPTQESEDAPADPDAGAEPEATAPAAADMPAKAAAEPGPAAVAALLAASFPALFGAGRALPIKLRIQVDIQQRAPGLVGRRALSAFLHRYTTSTAYLKALAASPQRIDLDGAPAGEIAEEHRQAAVTELDRRRSLFEARRNAEREAQRQARAAMRPQRPTGPGAGAVAEPAAAGVPDAAGDEGPAGERGRVRPGPRRGAPHDRRPAGRPPLPSNEPGPRQPQPEGHARQPQLEGRPRPHRSGPPPPAPLPSGPEDQARRDRLLLLRAYESSTLTRANFCVLKRISETDLEAALAQARQEQGPSGHDTRPQGPRESHGGAKPPFRQAR